ncbi:hypothetical protein EKO29_10460 [Colwellia sp. Arc7-635]|uniref:hypothetical protein n=1 Tax=Colwellia sp. Arc7-635 TaxID=2497879 RepID=UPI000F850A30|nr:hypothetical protein [Colwellia sp. Arc7-635]AZQ84404.1 hypothetical protein EKO29_10460 [Colwellia sp. Arc7-635]
MASFIWGRNPQEAFKNPYEWEANEQFALEASSLLEKFFEILMKKNMHYKKSDTSLEKAEWMLLTDAVDSLIEALVNLECKKHRITARLFRDVIESIDLLTFFRSGTTKAENKLAKWFNNEFIPHSVSRDHLLKTDGEEAKAERTKYYQSLSSFTHRKYAALCDSYSLGRGEMLVYDTITSSRMMVLPQTLSAYYAGISDLIIQLSQSLSLSAFITKTELSECWEQVIKVKSVPRRFVKI